ncbi:succinyl-diaminopimelate desuccinylase [Sphingomicrobium nitratireducens]|uniref:succinyl-diaminopimelate desuccinylase n=1 Tax=Sphingomicrobium nitratireducens TaxID=2964666 RepID=UPI00223ED62C|nr:succinyl-diaminopimelate desuccinylase [Sphingomicrobium nitratireducens]
MIDPVALAADLIRVPSVTPARGEVFDVLQAALEPLGFTVHRFVLGEEPDGPTENMVAIREAGAGPHLAFAGHLDVVEPGGGWETDPFEPHIEDGVLTGRGATDMKSAIAAFVAALDGLPHKGTLSLMITGDEEGYATYGSPRIIEWIEERGIRPDMMLIGEPTSVDRLGDTIKQGRRGSVNMWITVPGHQGHVAYPHLADNPVPALAKIIAAVEAEHWDDGTDAFQPSNLEFTGIDTPTHASNVIPGEASAQLNIRFNDLHHGEALVDRVREIAHSIAPDAHLRARISGEAFLTPEGPLTHMLVAAIEEETGITPELSTKGGTSDGRFFHKICPVIDFGLPNASMHKVGEHARLEDIASLARIYRRFVEKVFA